MTEHPASHPVPHLDAPTGPRRACVAVVAGSIRRTSINRGLALLTVDELLAHGADARFVDLSDFDMPIYHGDLEAEHGQPEAARRLHDILREADGIVVVSPEYNGAMTPLLKNTVDWVTRVDRAALGDRLTALMAASPGRRGGVGSLAMIRAWFEYMGMSVHDEHFSLPHAGDALREVDGVVRLDDAVASRLAEFVTDYLEALDASMAELAARNGH